MQLEPGCLGQSNGFQAHYVPKISEKETRWLREVALIVGAPVESGRQDTPSTVLIAANASRYAGAPRPNYPVPRVPCPVPPCRHATLLVPTTTL